MTFILIFCTSGTNGLKSVIDSQSLLRIHKKFNGLSLNHTQF